MQKRRQKNTMKSNTGHPARFATAHLSTFFRNIIPSSILDAKKLLKPGYFTDDPLSQRIEILISPRLRLKAAQRGNRLRQNGIG